MSIKTDSNGNHFVDDGRDIPKWLQQRQYPGRKEREAEFERLIIELMRFRDSQGCAVHMPQLFELVNIYNQAEESK